MTHIVHMTRTHLTYPWFAEMPTFYSGDWAVKKKPVMRSIRLKEVRAQLSLLHSYAFHILCLLEKLPV